MSDPKVVTMPGRYAILHRHFRTGSEGYYSCGYCDEIWPCGTVKIAEYSRDLERQLAQARAALQEIKEDAELSLSVTEKSWGAWQFEMRGILNTALVALAATAPGRAAGEGASE